MHITITYESLSDDELICDILESRFKDKINFTFEFRHDMHGCFDPYFSNELIAWITSQSYSTTIVYMPNMRNQIHFTYMKHLRGRQL